MKNQLISVGLLSLVLAGCNMTDFRLPTIGESNSDSTATTATTKTASDSQSNIVRETLNNQDLVLRNLLKILYSKIADDFLISSP